jgi:hypothetical protein
MRDVPMARDAPHAIANRCVSSNQALAADAA